MHPVRRERVVLRPVGDDAVHTRVRAPQQHPQHPQQHAERHARPHCRHGTARRTTGSAGVREVVVTFVPLVCRRPRTAGTGHHLERATCELGAATASAHC